MEIYNVLLVDRLVTTSTKYATPDGIVRLVDKIDLPYKTLPSLPPEIAINLTDVQSVSYYHREYDPHKPDQTPYREIRIRIKNENVVVRLPV